MIDPSSLNTTSENAASKSNNSHSNGSPQLDTANLEDNEDEPPSTGFGFSQSPVEMTTAAAEDRTNDVEPQHVVVDDNEKQQPHNGHIRRRSRFNRVVVRLQHAYKRKKPGIGPHLPTPTYMQSFRATIRYTPLNICLLFIPVSWGLYWGMEHTAKTSMLVFIFSAIGIVPLAALLGFGTEQISIRTTSSVGGLLNATLGNIVEMIIAGIALKKCDLELVQSSLLGGLLSNLLLVLGMAFTVGGYRFPQEEFQPMVAQLNSSLMTVSVISLIVPAAFHEFLGDRLQPGEEIEILLQLSRGSAVILILMYSAYLFFQFYSHNHLFLDTIQNSSYSSSSSGTSRRQRSYSQSDLPSPVTSCSSTTSSSDSEGPELAKLNFPFAFCLLVIVTALAYITSEHLVESLNSITENNSKISKEWLTLILIPIISNAAEHTTAVLVARKGKFDLAMSVAVGSCIQIAVFVIPVLVLVAWIMGKPLTLYFDPLETLVLFLSVLLTKFSIEDGKAHWMSGIVLIGVYVLIALCFWEFPEGVRIVQGQPLLCT